MRILIAIIILFISEASALGAGAKGSAGAQFLKIAPGARAVGMGEAFGGVAEGVFAAYYNPAGLAFLDRVEATASGDRHFQGISHNYGSIAVPLLSGRETRRKRNALGTAAFSITSLSISDIERRGVIETDAPQGSFGASDFSYALSYGLALTPRFALGAGAKFIAQRLDAARGSAWSLDAGALLREEKFSLGAGLRNFGQGVKLGSVSDPLPTTAYAGAAYRPWTDWLAAVELRRPSDDSILLSLGVEHTRAFNPRLSGALRAGFNTANTDADGFGGATLGGAVVYKRSEFGVAWAPMGELGSTFRYSLLLRF